MAGDDDDSEKTEEPSQKRLDEARKRGDIAKSQEVTTWFMILAATLFVMIFAGDMAVSLAAILSSFIANVGEIPDDSGAISNAVWQLLSGVAVVVLLPLLVFFAAGIGGNLVQHPPLLTTEPMQPKFSKISPLAGIKRLFSAQSLVNFIKSLIKLVVVGAVVIAILWPRRDVLESALDTEPLALLLQVRDLSLLLLGGVLAIFTVIAGLDYYWQRHSWNKKLRMSLKELRDEYKEQEGDPHIEARIRQIRRERASRRMMAQVPQASVVITNPTHFSIALKYEPGMPAPICVAKGQDLVALKIREIAREHDIPLVENQPLARALYATVEVDGEIPLEHYKAVAEIIGFVLRLKNKS